MSASIVGAGLTFSQLVLTGALFVVLAHPLHAAPPIPTIIGVTPDTGTLDDGEPYAITASEYHRVHGKTAPNGLVIVQANGTESVITADEFGDWSVGLYSSFDAVGFGWVQAAAKDNSGTSAWSRTLAIAVVRPPHFEMNRLYWHTSKGYFMVGEPVEADTTEMITNDALVDATVTATGLPPGIRIEGTKILGTPTTPGSYRVTFSADNGAGITTETHTVKVHGAPAPPPDTRTSSDVGSVGVAGSSVSSGDTLTVRGSGADIWGTVDSFHFVYRKMSGPIQIEAQVASLTNTNSWAKAGLMIRESTAPNARNIMALMTPSNVMMTQFRYGVGGTTVATDKWWLTPNTWLRIIRNGDNFATYSSPDRQRWILRGTATIAGMPNEVLVGFAVTSHNNSQIAEAVFRSPTIGTP